MDEDNHCHVPQELEATIAKNYKQRIELMTSTENLSEFLGCAISVYSALEDSRPAEGRGLEWAEDMIKSYRTIGRIIAKRYEDFRSGEIERTKIKDFENKF